FPDRVAKRRTPTGRDLVLAGGGSAELSEASVVHDAAWVVAVDVEERGRQGARRTATVRIASSIEPDWLLELFPDEVAARDAWIGNGDAERVDRLSRITYGQVALEESRGPATPGPETARVLAEQALSRGLESFAPEVGNLLARL